MQISINVMSKTPAYVQLADQIKAAIDAGQLQPHDKIPSIKQLIEQTGLAMATVQKAIKRLEQETTSSPCRPGNSVTSRR